MEAKEDEESTIIGVIFRRTIRASYASIDLITSPEENCSSLSTSKNHYVALIQFHDVEKITDSRTYIRRECKLGSKIKLRGIMRNNRFQVQLQYISSTNGQSCTNGTFTGLEIIQRQALDMIQCQQAREKYYPKFEKEVKEKIKVDTHSQSNNRQISMSKKKQKNTEGTGHGGGVGKRKQGEIVRDFLLRLIFHEKLSDTKEKNIVSSKDRFVDLSSDKLGDLDVNDMRKTVDYLNEGSGVLDVAGGSGHLSLALSLYGIKSTVIDPRQTVGKLPARDRKALRKAIKSSQSKTVDGDDSKTMESKKVNILPPPMEFKAMRAWFAKRPDGIDSEFREGQPSNAGDECSENELPVCTMCSPVLASCSAIIALHPDEATGDIVDFAVENKLPFVVVPCCVFSRLFPFRFIPSKDGGDQQKLVSTYDDLIEYLVSKHPSIRMSKLDFDGANTAIWSTFS
ncbi:hypothetical protein CTEN210_09241 [Chaetoceros tenuissimus]|uniref:Methyltransferase domain-containing protein n=1 Tax=Chaetoceros tenuissimus TaxID=426638 RepID=A0AAD3CXI9_9STRA|nr:hypothetical protein CTEN210_09241 [Chaetoceros tenuissimus]